jgi:predicted 3-demethylubiquinone-9 3-methyltransferase (glyoxalase superfamily)
MPKSKTARKASIVDVLNKPGYHSTAAVSGEVQVSKFPREKKHSYFLDGEFCLSDCSRQVTIQVDCDDRASFENAVAKLKKIEDAAKFLREQMERLAGWES